MNLALWIVAGLLAFAFLYSSAAKLFLPKEKLAVNALGQWTRDFSPVGLKAIAVLELLGAVGLIVERRENRIWHAFRDAVISRYVAAMMLCVQRSSRDNIPELDQRAARAHRPP